MVEQQPEILQTLQDNFNGNDQQINSGDDQESPPDIYDLLFYGKYNYLQVENQQQIDKNRDVIYTLTSHISWVNTTFFKE